MSRAHTGSPVDGIDILLADLDGVIYRGGEEIPYAVESINAVGQATKVAYITNNASRTDRDVAAHLTSLGLSVEADQVVTSPQAAVRLLGDLVPIGSMILVVGGDGVVDELVKAGYRVTRSGLDEPAAVLQGFSPMVGWEQLAEASFTLGAQARNEIPWVATNTDWTIPQARGTAPGNGTLVSAVHTATGRLPIVAGKPEGPIFKEALARFGATTALMVGDRLDTDILGANRAGISSALVLTGIDQAKQVLAAVGQERPGFIIADLRGLREPYPETDTYTRGSVVHTRVGRAIVRQDGNRLTAASGSGIDLLRAAAAAIWNSGSAIYALDVAPELYS